jgi:hypothetical protein
MSSEFLTYFQLGLAHIADLAGYDHILFIVALTSGFALRDWKRLLWLVTAFTLGHSVTLALATLGLVRVHVSLIELLIAVTIVLTGVYGIAQARQGQENARRSVKALYVMAGGFGLVHGLGFSNYLRSILGGEESIVLPLFSFNVGLEIGQLLIVGAILVLGALICDIAGLTRRYWSGALSALAIGLGMVMIVQRV